MEKSAAVPARDPSQQHKTPAHEPPKSDKDKDEDKGADRRDPPPPPHAKPLSASMSVAPGRAGGYLKVAYSALALGAQREVKSVTLMIWPIPANQNNTPLNQLQPPQNEQILPQGWSKTGLHANPFIYDSTIPPLPPQQQDPNPNLRILYEMTVKLGPAGNFPDDETVSIRVALYP